YEYALTVDQEARLIWKGKMSMSPAVFLINRYVPPIWVIAVLLRRETHGELREAFSGVRVWALTGRDWRPTTVTLIFGIVPFVANVV
ncbi:uncharacterized protein LAESUDRAFT_613780, partial [Laetiporus sulphureus 93-53]